MAPARPFWKGYLKLSLVSCPIALYTGTTSTERVSFRQINKKTGNRLRQQLIDEVTREPVEGENKGRGYEYSKNAYIPVDDDELDAIAIESSHTIEINSFVPREQIDERYLDTPYYITPNDQVGQDAFAVIREAMRGKGMVALARVVLAKRERVIMLEPWDKGLMGTTLRYPYEIRDAKEYFDDIPDVKVEPDMLKLAEHILQSKAADFDPAQFVDHYEEAVVEYAQEEAGRHAGITGARGAAGEECCEPHGRAPPQHCRGKSRHPLRRGRRASVVSGRARCCFPFTARRATRRGKASGTAERSSEKGQLSR